MLCWLPQWPATGGVTVRGRGDVTLLTSYTVHGPARPGPAPARTTTAPAARCAETAAQPSPASPAQPSPARCRVEISGSGLVVAAWAQVCAVDSVVLSTGQMRNSAQGGMEATGTNSERISVRRRHTEKPY